MLAEDLVVETGASRLMRRLAAVVIFAAMQRCVSGADVAATQEKPVPAIRPQFERITLALDGRTPTAQSVRDPWSPVHATGAKRFAVRDDQVQEISREDGKPIWSLTSADRRHLAWLAGGGDIAYLIGFRPGDEQHPNQYDAPPQVRRLDLLARKWLRPLPLTIEKKVPDQRDLVIAAVADAEHLAVLTQQTVPGERDQEKAIGYRITCFRTGGPESGKPVWSHPFQSNGGRPSPGVFLMASVMPAYANSDVRHLTWLGADLLVCGGEKEDLVCFDTMAGKVKWRVARLWEYQRGFIGPSVWQHNIAPFGDHGRDAYQKVFSLNPEHPDYAKAVEEADRTLAEVRAAFDKKFLCAIVGGPVVVLPAGSKAEDAHIFVAVAKGPNAWNWGCLSDCLVYELNGRGQVIGMGNLPRMVKGDEFTIARGGVVWLCQNGSMVRIEPRNSEENFHIGPGGPDLVCEPQWYHQLKSARQDAWLSAGLTAEVAAFGVDDGFLTIAGGYVRDRARHVYEFPLTVIDLKNGTDRTAVLAVPFEGDMPLPKTNFSGDGQKAVSSGPHLLGITALRLDDGRLEVTLGREGSAVAVSFDVGTRDVKRNR
jgi:hypothetical protein